MAGGEDNHLRMVALCRRMGELWSEEDITNLGADIPEQERQESERTL